MSRRRPASWGWSRITIEADSGSPACPAPEGERSGAAGCPADRREGASRRQTWPCQPHFLPLVRWEAETQVKALLSRAQ